MQRIPASFTRVMHTPSPPIEVRQRPNEVLINYEFMDVHRIVPIAPGMAPAKAPVTVSKHPHLGRSVARYEGDVLVIETAGQRAGILDTLGAPGLVQSDHMRTEETQLLPAAQKVFSPEDWAELDAAFLKDRDPLAGGARDPCYDRLFTRIVLTAPAPIGVGAA